MLHKLEVLADNVKWARIQLQLVPTTNVQVLFFNYAEAEY